MGDSSYFYIGGNESYINLSIGFNGMEISLKKNMENSNNIIPKKRKYSEFKNRSENKNNKYLKDKY
jgi:hypothetical protein